MTYFPLPWINTWILSKTNLVGMKYSWLLTSVVGFDKIQLLIQGREKNTDGRALDQQVDLVENNNTMGASGWARKPG